MWQIKQCAVWETRSTRAMRRRRRRRWRHFSKLHSRTLAKVSGQRACLSFCVALALVLHILGPNVKNPPKIRLKKFVKLTDHTWAGNDLTSFEYEDHAKTGNGSYEYADTCTKNSWNHLEGTYFWRVFSHLEPLWVVVVDFSYSRVQNRTDPLEAKWCTHVYYTFVVHD